MAWTRSADTRRAPVGASAPGTRSGPHRPEPAAGTPGGDWKNLVAQMHHDIRTPLNAMIGFADAMHLELHGALGDARYREYVRHIRECGARLLRMAEDTLTMTALATRPHAAEREHVPVAALVATVLAETACESDGCGLVIDCLVPIDLQVVSDRQVVGQAIRALCRAAIARAAPGAILRVDAREHHGSVAIELILIGSPEGGDAVRSSFGWEDALAGEAELALARMLLTLQGAGLDEHRSTDGTWSVIARFEAASQSDLFADPTCA